MPSYFYPLKIHEGVLVAAGAVGTKDVPVYAIAIAGGVLHESLAAAERSQ